MSQSNPFTPTFGQAPFALAGRDALIQDAMDGLANTPGDPNRATIFMGARGSGKTVLLHKISNEALAAGWVCINVTCSNGMLEQIEVATQEAIASLLDMPQHSRLVSLQAGPISATREFLEQKTTWRSRMTHFIEQLNEAEIGLLFTIDEISSDFDEFKEFIITYQHFVTEGRNVALFMAGLPSRVSVLLMNDQVSFVRRAFQRDLESIDIIEVERSMESTIVASGRSIDAQALHIAAKASSGYAFLIQLIGYYLWRHHPENNEISIQDAKAAIKLSAHEMERAVFVPTLKELTKREAQFLYALAQKGGVATLEDIARALEISTNNASKLRRRLLEHGMIREVGIDRLTFELPLFGDYLKANPLI